MIYLLYFIPVMLLAKGTLAQLDPDVEYDDPHLTMLLIALWPITMLIYIFMEEQQLKDWLGLEDEE